MMSANPSALVGPTAINGSSNAWMTSDSAPAINLAAAYPWTGAHTWTVTGVVGISVTSGGYNAIQANSSSAAAIVASSSTNNALNATSGGNQPTIDAVNSGAGIGLNATSATGIGISVSSSSTGAALQVSNASTSYSGGGGGYYYPNLAINVTAGATALQSLTATSINSTGGIGGSSGMSISGTSSLQAVTATNLSLSGTGSLLQVGSAEYNWNSNQTAIDFAGSGTVYGDAVGNFSLANNLYYSAGSSPNWTYKTGTSGTKIGGGLFQFGSTGAFNWFTSVPGTAGATATLTVAMSLSVAGLLNVGGVTLGPAAGIAVPANTTGSLLQLASVQFPWYTTNQYAIDIGLASGIRGDTVNTIEMDSNLYYGGAGPNWRYKTGAAGAYFNVAAGAFSWATAPTGAANAVATMTARMALSNTGALTVNGAAVTSDLRLKKNVHPIVHALDVIQDLNGVCFDWIETDSPSVGLIAQDVERSFPELVGPGPDPKYKSLNYNGIIAILVEAVKEQQQQIQELQRKAA